MPAPEPKNDRAKAPPRWRPQVGIPVLIGLAGLAWVALIAAGSAVLKILR
jgi:hypothetical protein